MFFILRCIFWLSLVWLHLPGAENPAASATQFLDMASAHVGSFARSKTESIARQGAETLVARIADDGAEWCRAHGEACADAVLAAMVDKSGSADARKPAPVDTLTPADKAHRWHVPHGS